MLPPFPPEQCTEEFEIFEKDRFSWEASVYAHLARKFREP